MKIGLNAKAYHGAAGANPADEISKVKEVSISLSSGVAESNTRASAWKQKMAALREGSVEMTLEWDGMSADQAALQTAFLAGTTKSYKFLDADSGYGIYGDFVISSFERSEPLEDAMELSITLDLTGTPTEVAPA